MIENRNLEKGTKLVAYYHKQAYGCEVVEVEEGRLRYKLEDGREFKSPSAAGTAITGKACNGWMFWTVFIETQSTEASAEESTEPVAQENIENVADTSTEEKPTEAKKTGTYKMRNQKGAPKGLARWFCYDCAEPFNAPSGEKHAVCPNSHSHKK